MAQDHSFHRPESTGMAHRESTYHPILDSEFRHVEDLERYRTGGYYPVDIGDPPLNGRYRVVHKLGYGTFSIVWLAIDEKTSRYVAVKIGTADAGHDEYHILSRLTRGTTGDRSSRDNLSLLPVVLDHFNVKGDNGIHLCLVTFPAMGSLHDSKEATWSGLFQLDTARSLAAQAAKAVAMVHAQGYVHGDLHMGNFLLQISPSLDGLSEKQLYSKYGEPEKSPIIRRDQTAPGPNPNAPEHAVFPLLLAKASDEITPGEAKLMLNDFGQSYRPGETSKFHSAAPAYVRAPDQIFEPETPLSFASDIWSLACIIFELVAHSPLFSGSDRDTPGQITAQHVEVQGMMPPDWLARWKERSIWYDQAGKPLRGGDDVRPWEHRIHNWVQEPRKVHNLGTISDEEWDALLDLLKEMLAWRSSDRPSIKKVLESKWMTKWALPTYEKWHRPS